jgi:hypothetical protein
MRHDAHAGRVFVDQDVVRSLVRAIREEVRGGRGDSVVVVLLALEGEEAGDHGVHEPLGEGLI